jgi:glycine cleavage system aminomethyltransferase T
MENNSTIIDALKDSFNDLQINSYDVVDCYTSVSSEYDSLIQGVGIRDISHSKKIFIHGKESINLINRLTTNNVSDLGELEWCRTIFTNSEGNIIDRTLLLKFEDYFLLVGACPDKNKLRKWIERFIMTDDISTSDVSTDYSMFEVMGPESESYMSIILGDKLDKLQDKKIIRAQVENFFIHCVKYSEVGNVDKYIVVVESKFANNMCHYFLDNASAFDLKFVGETAYNIFRIEQGIPVVPNELNDKFNPCEANLEDDLDTEKKGYIGCKQIGDSSSKQNAGSRLTGFKFHDKLSDDSLNITIHDDEGVKVGVITSLISSHLLENSIGMGYVDSEIKHKELMGINGTKKYKVTLTDFPIKR